MSTVPQSFVTDLRSRPRSSDRQRGLNYWRDLDWILIVAAVGLTIFGSLLVWSASIADLASPNDPQSFLKKHLIGVAIAVPIGFLVSRLDYRWLRAYTPIIYGFSVLALLLTFVPGLGRTIAGARAWVELPLGQTLQPSEFTKIAIILMMAAILGEKRDIETEPRDRDVMISLVVAGLPLGIILLQNDTGTALVIAAVVIAIIAISGARTRWVVGLIGGGILLMLVAVQVGLLKQYQVARLTSFINPSDDVAATGYNANQARIAVGGGGWSGYGLFQGPQTQGNFVPVNESDFVFTVAGEEFGFIGGAVIVVLLGIVLWRGIMIGLRADDMYGRLVATGVVSWFGFQMFENIGMTLGLMPITGIPLPFVSSGGTAMMACWIGVGLLVNVRLHARGLPS